MADIDDYADMVTPGAEEEGLIERLKSLVTGPDSETNLKILSNLTGMDENHLRQIVVPMINVVERHGLKFISGGNDERGESIRGKLKSFDKYASVVVDFLPLFTAIKEMISSAVSNRIPNVDISEDEWSHMPSVDTIVDVHGEEMGSGDVKSDASDFLRSDDVRPSAPQSNPWEKLLEEWGQEYGADAASEIRKDMEEKGLIKAKKNKISDNSDDASDEIEPDDSFFFD